MLVPSRVDRRTAVGRRIYMTLERFGLRVGPAIRQRSAHIEAFENGAWIGAHAPTSPAYREIRVLKDRILELLGETGRAPELEPAPPPPLPVAGRTFGRRVNWSPNPAPLSPSAG
jgi:chromosome partitioning protein